MLKPEFEDINSYKYVVAGKSLSFQQQQQLSPPSKPIITNMKEFIEKTLKKHGLDYLYVLEFEDLYCSRNIQNSSNENPIVYSRDGKLSYSSKERAVAKYTFGVKDMQEYAEKGKMNWKWNCMNPKHILAPYYTPINEDDKTLVFESRFESGNLGLVVKLSENEYYLLMQNDTLTKGNTQCKDYYLRLGLYNNNTNNRVLFLS